MPFPGDTKQAYCSICGRETTWEYTIIQLEDGELGLLNLFEPEAHQVRFWRCCCHATEEGRLKEEYRKKLEEIAHHKAHPAHTG